MHKIRVIDLFAGIGGMRRGFESACESLGVESECVFTSEIKPHAVKVLAQNYPGIHVSGDISGIEAGDIPDFDFLLAGFQCQAFSSAGKRRGFDDKRGTLFFEVLRILKAKRPRGFLLENVEGLANHDGGKTLRTITDSLSDAGYHVNFRVLNAKDFGVPQDRRRIYIAGNDCMLPDLTDFEATYKSLGEILEHGLPCERSAFIDTLLEHYTPQQLQGKSIKDKRGGRNNIHSWDIALKGPVSRKQRELLCMILTERRKKHWADVYGIDWMDGMPLTLDMIRTFYDDPELEAMLEDLTAKKYLVKEHPKRLVNGRRIKGETLPEGYNIVAGKISYQVNRVLDPAGIAPTLVAMDMERLYVADGSGIRKLTMREGLRLFGYPESFRFEGLTLQEGCDLLGNTVAVPVVSEVSKRIFAGDYRMKRTVTAREIYDELMNIDRITELAGVITLRT